MSDGSVIIEIDGDSSKFQQALSKVGSVASTALKGLGIAAGAAAGAVATIGKAAVTAYADYEQLVGGVETLFKDSASTVMEYANNAYKTAGMSANTYMETVTSFSASLLQSVGNDTAEAARVADMAITDMADNANKMGTPIERLQDAYQGFAKANYTMLDNLKLGYGGTKTEMERLLADAEKITGIKYDISNLNDVYQAIHVIQEEMDISGLTWEQAMEAYNNGTMTWEEALDSLGTTAKEATSTIQGSLAMTKASWENLLVGMADDTQDFDALLDNFINSISILGDNLLPRIQIVLEGVVKLVTALGPKIAEAIPGLVASVLPGLLEGVVSIVTALVNVIPGLLDTLIQVVLDQGPSLIQAGMDLVLLLYDGLTSALPTLLTAAAEIITTIVTMLTDPDALSGLMQSSISLITALVEGITSALPILIAAAPVIIQNLVTAIAENLPLILETGAQLMQELLSAILDSLPEILAAGVSLIASLTEGLIQNGPAIMSAIGSILWEMVETILSYLPELLEQGTALISALISGAVACIPSIIEAAWELIRSFGSAFLEFDWSELGMNIIDGIYNGIVSGVGAIISAAKQAAQAALDAAKSALGINSPSKVFKKEVGHWIPPGIGEGIEESMPELNADMRKSLMHTIDDASSAVASEVGSASRRLSGTGSAPSGGSEPRVVTNENGITVIVYYNGTGEPEDVKKIGRQIGVETSKELRRKGLPMK